MEFSRYVIEAIASVDYVDKDRDFNAVSLIKGAAERTGNTEDAHILNVISGSMTMTYKKKEQVFAPLFVEYNGSRSFGPEDISEDDIDILRHVMLVTKSVWLQTRFAHVVWTITKEQHFGKVAVMGYLKLFQEKFDTERWVKCYEVIQAAYHIASEMRKPTDVFKQTRSAILQKLNEINGTDPLFLSIRLLELIFRDLEKDELPKYVGVAENLFRKNINQDNDNLHLADESFSILEKFYKKMKKNEDTLLAKGQYAGYYESHARRLADNKDYFRAIFVMKKACSLYTGVNREKVIELRLEMETWQRLALKDMHPVATKIDVKETTEVINRLFDGLSLSETIVQFGRVAKIHTIDEVKKRLTDERDQQPILSMFRSGFLNNKGQIVQELPPINNVDENSEAFRKHMVRYVAEERRMFDSIPVRLAYEHVRKFGIIAEDAIDFLVQDNAVIPDRRADIIKEGISLALNGKLYAAMHILLPQTEHIFRCLVKECGDTVTFLKEDGSEEYKPLSSLFKSEKLRECYDEDLLFTFQSIMDDSIGENLRNLNGHGLLDPDTGNGTGVLCFLSLLIMLISLYGKESISIRIDLARRELKQPGNK